ncbi:hypothetical protein LTR10_018442 [Elasticomyces elasticus]|nr:hypothetical protein LTR10_018442 [Elasticomyces elasticus]KAK5036805.1 hypothetical protein LTR13_005185 [Exophiala sideris]
MAYVPGLTLPSSIFSNAPVSILLPLGLGLGAGLISQPGKLNPKNFSDKTAKERGKFRSTQEQYVALKQPPFRPPPWVFAPAWSTLYLMMGYAAHRAWTTGRPIEAMLDIVTLTGTVGYLTYIWQKVDPVAAYLMVPYLAWLGFATYLTAGTGYLNGWTMKSAEQSEEQAELKKDS